MRWCYSPVPDHRIEILRNSLSINPIVARILYRLGFTEASAAHDFLNPKLRNLRNPFEIRNLDLAVERLQRAMRERESILVFGDYDVDGVTSTTLLVSSLRHLGIFPRYVVPQRLSDGYGLSPSAINRALAQDRPDLLVAVDCGTNSSGDIAHLRSLGVDVIILDHHSSKDSLPKDCILVNPHVHDSPSAPWRHLSSVGLVFKLVHGLIKQLRDVGDEAAHEFELKDHLDLVALGTIADLVPLLGENRILASHGLLRLRSAHRPGINALLEVSGKSIGEDISPFDVSFRLGPRINACGRLANALLPINMLLSENWTECSKAARKVDSFNRKRQEIEKAVFLQAEEQVNTELAGSSGLVLHNSSWHPGVVGIVASRLAQLFNRPSIVLGEEGGFAKGSGRSISGVNLVDLLRSCHHLLDSWGGHPMATGVSLKAENVEKFRTAFNQVATHELGGSIPEKELELTQWIQLEDIDERLLDDLECLHPYGQNNPEPIFGLKRVSLNRTPSEFGNGHLRFQLNDSSRRPLAGVAWKMSQRRPPVGDSLDLAVRANWNTWNGRRNPQVELVDWRIS
ncbi:MAG: Single-stranded-DNA-specific exonuclease RecJ [Candidatus Moanabacter tarae]|uniref:Single-stranded-DNA-specific exonuclease RecJ n=1 Tax=Candidatus Moanibacter tarae TaxID=2200854 RepID=A0A2Z4AF91_9BACT|nr:MAG: Single-stranded-DNA-specific exonuclease RecJ [Candidatus Moanabacter tarae]|tara:strand:- start:30452 stop:32161 length:1710 start_codon:yes stop_codon:yes gene_type:complete